jgi:hypothetical protein
MAYFGPIPDRRELNKKIIASNIARDPVGRNLTPQVRERAIDFAVDNWPANTGNGEAARIGIRHVTSGVLKTDK